MTGALAWQVNNYLNKMIIFVFGGRSHGDFPGSPPPLCVPLSLTSLCLTIHG
ncbi:hypothetical protein OIU74_004795 [Salix koriyanagi]|uniref:Uncharacterized protein n=1 Tax=Salix koriyanagi TaxID=2511006 RepID=A0A9Q0ZFW8_9ROSI|nr:hypothetical protein OIU74_004795 [Salix koriyanagi]